MVTPTTMTFVKTQEAAVKPGYQVMAMLPSYELVIKSRLLPVPCYPVTTVYVTIISVCNET
jgi:hypothetical protein